MNQISCSDIIHLSTSPGICKRDELIQTRRFTQTDDEMHDDRRGAARRVEFQTSIVQVDTANVLRDRHLTRRLLWI